MSGCVTRDEAKLNALVNNYRQARDLPPLAVSRQLHAAAKLHALDMAAHNYVAHDSPAGKNADDRLEEAGYPDATWGENVAAGYDDADRTFDQWRESPGHHANLINPNYTETAVARATGGRYGFVWCQVFGGAKTKPAARCWEEPEPRPLPAPDDAGTLPTPAPPRNRKRERRRWKRLLRRLGVR